MVTYGRGVAGAVLRTLQAKLNDTPSVQDYGVIGDGTTDERGAIAALLTLLGSGQYEMFFPGGYTYKIGSNLTIPRNATLRMGNGAKLLIPDGVTLTLSGGDLRAGRTQVFQCTGTGKVVGTIANDTIFPEWWGAVADGLNPNVGADFSQRAAAATRNNAPLQAALDFAGYRYSIDGLTGTVSFTYGFYVHSNTLNVPLSVNIVGYGIGSAIFFYSPTGNQLSFVGTNNHLVSDIFLAPLAGPTWNYTTGYGLYMDGVSTPNVRNVWSSSFGGGCFFFKNVIEGRINGLICDNSNGPSFTFRGVGQGSVVSNCVTAGSGGTACFDIQSGYDWHFIGCTAKDADIGTYGFYLNGVENINMTNCGAHSISHEGIYLTATCINNTLVSCFVNDASTTASGVYSAIVVSGTRNVLIAPKVTGNTPTYQYGIFLGGAATDCIIRDPNVTPGTLGAIFEGQPIGVNSYQVRKVSTANATPLNIWAKGLNNNAGCYIKAIVIAKQRASVTEFAAFEITAFAQTSGAGTTLTAPVITSTKGNAATTMAATLVLTTATANAGVVNIQVTGLGTGASVDWEAHVQVLSVTG